MTAPVCFKRWRHWLWELRESGFSGAHWGRSPQILRRCKAQISASSKSGRRINLSRSKLCVWKWRGKHFELSRVISLGDFRGAQAASLLLLAACRQHADAGLLDNMRGISASCRDEQASSLCSPEGRRALPVARPQIRRELYG